MYKLIPWENYRVYLTFNEIQLFSVNLDHSGIFSTSTEPFTRNLYVILGYDCWWLILAWSGLCVLPIELKVCHKPVMTSFPVLCIMSHVTLKVKCCVSFFSEPSGTHVCYWSEKREENEHFFSLLFCWDIPKSLSSGLTKSSSFAFLALPWPACLIKER